MAFMWIQVFQTESYYWSDACGYTIAHEMNSEYFKRQMKIRDLKDFNPTSLLAKAWIKNLDGSWRIDERTEKMDPHAEFHHQMEESLKNDFSHKKHGEGFFAFRNMIHFQIFFMSRPIYKNYTSELTTAMMTDYPHYRSVGFKLIAKIVKSFDAESSHPLLSNDGEVIGKVTARVSSGIIVILLIIMLVSIILVALLSLIVANLAAKLFSLPLLIPLSKLDENLRHIAAGDYDHTLRSQIVLKRPLKEIESLANSTNIIITKMKEYADLLADQKDELESQRDELEAQNEALIQSQKAIQEAQTLLVQSEQMASVGQLTAAITHEINTPLGAIHSNVQMIEMFIAMLSQNPGIQGDDALKSLVQQMSEANAINLMASHRVSEIIKSLKSFSRMDQAEFQEVDIHEGIRSVLVLTSNLWKRNITIQEEFGELPMVRCYPGMLNQVFMNIIVNAIHAIREEGKITIRTSLEDRCAVIRIRDNGCGIPEENLEKIFESGFSTKCWGNGMGLGLSICRNIIKKHRGDIIVQSVVGDWTEFTIRIPLNPDDGVNKEGANCS